MQQWVRDLNKLYSTEAALYQTDADPRGFAWIDCLDRERSIVAFLRRAPDHSDVIFVCNFTPVPRENYRLGVPEATRYSELLNSDATCYGGSGMGNGGAVQAEDVPLHGQPASLSILLPPLSILVLRAQ
jgi:1,4-alpha-glucan branching enzyme